MLPSSPQTIQAQLRSRVAGDDWRLAEHGFDPSPAAESVFALGNGYLGVRGTPEEGTPVHEPGAVLNGFHETWPIVYPEDALRPRTHGPEHRQRDRRLDRPARRRRRAARHHACGRASSACSTCAAPCCSAWSSSAAAGGHRLRLRTRRLVSLEDRHLLAIEYELHALDGPVRSRSPPSSSRIMRRRGRRPAPGKGFAEPVLVPMHAAAEGTRAMLALATRSSGLVLACGMDHRIDGPAELELAAAGDGAELLVLAGLEAGETLRIEKFVAYHWGEDDRSARVVDTLDRALGTGYPGVELAHRRRAAAFWERARRRARGRARASSARSASTSSS